MTSAIPQAQKFPLADIDPDAKTSLYISVLERRLVANEILLTQYRALLEALTGDTWDAIDTALSKEEIRKVAANAFERNLARDMNTAERMVDANISTANQTS